MERKFYAIKYAYGRNVINNGNRADEVYRFDTIAERTRFVNDWEREGIDVDPVPASHPEVRKAIRYAAQGFDWPQAV
jgi:hypothetical protein